MSAGCRLQLLAIKQFLTQKINSLKQMGCIETADTLRCCHCFERYTVLIEPGSEDPGRIPDVSEGITQLVELISAEHATRHSRDSLQIECELPSGSTDRPQQRNPFLNVRPGERITASWPAGLLGDCSLCSQCDKSAFRVVQLVSCARLHRYISLCEDHFMDTCLITPELIDLEFDNALKQVRLKLKA